MPLRIAGCYALAAGLWILFSDRLLGSTVRDPDLMTRIAMAKGWLFVAVTALLLHVLIRRFVDEVHRREHILTERNEAICLVEEELRQRLDEHERSRLELQEMNRALGESEERYRLLFASNPNPMWVYDLETLAFLEVNDAAVAHYGWSREEFLAMTIKDIRPPEDISALVENVRRVTSGIDRAGFWRHRKKDGTVICVEITSHSIDFAGHRAEVVLVSDVTERVRGEEEIRRFNAELEERVKVRTQELESFSYSVSHDLRAPLRHIDGFSRALMEDCGDQLDLQGKGYLTRICTAANRMGQLIDDLLQLASVSRSDLQRRPVSLSNLSRGVAADLKRSDPGRDVTFTIAGGVRAMGDPLLLRVVLENLLGNAWKYTGKEPHAVIEFGVMERDGDHVFFVRDNGVGFDMAYVNKLFSPFQRLHAMNEFEGTGIGLATVRRVVERHGGRVWAEGAIGEGATFFFTLGETLPAGENSEV